MILKNRTCVVTGGAHGIGKAIALCFAKEGAGVIVADLDETAAGEVAKQCGGVAMRCDVSKEAEIARLVEKAGRVDVFVSNAGIARGGGAEASDRDWQQSWEVNLMAHVWAARHVLPQMIARKEGYLVATASAAGLLTSLGAAPYAATKHAAVAFAEYLSITHHHQGIRVSCLCPQGVDTSMLAQAVNMPSGKAILAGGAVLTPEQVADATVKAMGEERFLILPHPEVAEYFKRKANDYERWLRGMRRLQATVQPLKAQA
jgi:NAD(P)-dependent dehydrogenase (short-subunit alcohol dehydrogenase family)